MIKFLRHIRDIPHPQMVWMIGNFDGVHCGHQALIEAAHLNAPKGTKVGLLTFEPHPRRFFNPNSPVIRVQQLSQKLRALEYYGVDYCYAYKFDHALAQMTADDFCHNILAHHLQPRTVIVGHDFCFGRGREGSPEYLIRAGQKYDFDVCVISEKAHMGKRFSSQNLRDFISNGEIDKIKSFLGREYVLTGRVLHGRKLARDIGYPTANISPPDVLYPMNGVYKGFAILPDNRKIAAIANIGTKPTVTDDKKRLIEIHIPHFNQHLYGQKIAFEFSSFIRKEKKFPSLEQLKLQIAQDIKQL